MKHATTDTILFSDDDVLVDNNSASYLENAMSDATVALVAGVDLQENGIYGSAAKPGLTRSLIGFFLGMKKPCHKDG